MRAGAILLVALALAPAAGARGASTFTVSVSGSANGVTVAASGADSQTVLDGIAVTASLPGGKTITAKSSTWAWKSKADPMKHTTAQTLTLTVQIASSTGLADCTAGTKGTVTLVDSSAKLKNGTSADTIILGGWSAPCTEFTAAFSNTGNSKATVVITRTP